MLRIELAQRQLAEISDAIQESESEARKDEAAAHQAELEAKRSPDPVIRKAREEKARHLRNRAKLHEAHALQLSEEHKQLEFQELVAQQAARRQAGKLKQTTMSMEMLEGNPVSSRYEWHKSSYEVAAARQREADAAKREAKRADAAQRQIDKVEEARLAEELETARAKMSAEQAERDAENTTNETIREGALARAVEARARQAKHAAMAAQYREEERKLKAAELAHQQEANEHIQRLKEKRQKIEIEEQGSGSTTEPSAAKEADASDDLSKVKALEESTAQTEAHRFKLAKEEAHRLQQARLQAELDHARASASAEQADMEADLLGTNPGSEAARNRAKEAWNLAGKCAADAQRYREEERRHALEDADLQQDAIREAARLQQERLTLEYNKTSNDGKGWQRQQELSQQFREEQIKLDAWEQGAQMEAKKLEVWRKDELAKIKEARIDAEIQAVKLKAEADTYQKQAEDLAKKDQYREEESERAAIREKSRKAWSESKRMLTLAARYREEQVKERAADAEREKREMEEVVKAARAKYRAVWKEAAQFASLMSRFRQEQTKQAQADAAAQAAARIAAVQAEKERLQAEEAAAQAKSDAEQAEREAKAAANQAAREEAHAMAKAAWAESTRLATLAKRYRDDEIKLAADEKAKQAAAAAEKAQAEKERREAEETQRVAAKKSWKQAAKFAALSTQLQEEQKQTEAARWNFAQLKWKTMEQERLDARQAYEIAQAAAEKAEREAKQAAENKEAAENKNDPSTQMTVTVNGKNREVCSLFLEKINVAIFLNCFFTDIGFLKFR